MASVLPSDRSNLQPTGRMGGWSGGQRLAAPNLALSVSATLGNWIN
jgi:hypothetical protein